MNIWFAIVFDFCQTEELFQNASIIILLRNAFVIFIINNVRKLTTESFVNKMRTLSVLILNKYYVVYDVKIDFNNYQKYDYIILTTQMFFWIFRCNFCLFSNLTVENFVNIIIEFLSCDNFDEIVKLEKLCLTDDESESWFDCNYHVLISMLYIWFHALFSCWAQLNI